MHSETFYLSDSALSVILSVLGKPILSRLYELRWACVHFDAPASLAFLRRTVHSRLQKIALFYSWNPFTLDSAAQVIKILPDVVPYLRDLTWACGCSALPREQMAVVEAALKQALPKFRVLERFSMESNPIGLALLPTLAKAKYLREINIYLDHILPTSTSLPVDSFPLLTTIVVASNLKRCTAFVNLFRPLAHVRIENFRADLFHGAPNIDLSIAFAKSITEVFGKSLASLAILEQCMEKEIVPVLWGCPNIHSVFMILGGKAEDIGLLVDESEFRWKKLQKLGFAIKSVPWVFDPDEDD